MSNTGTVMPDKSFFTAAVSVTVGFSHSLIPRSAGRITGVRSWISPAGPWASVVMMVAVHNHLAGSRNRHRRFVVGCGDSALHPQHLLCRWLLGRGTDEAAHCAVHRFSMNPPRPGCRRYGRHALEEVRRCAGGDSQVGPA